MHSSPPWPRSQPRLEPKPVESPPTISPHDTIMLYQNAAYFSNMKLHEKKTPQGCINPSCVSQVYYGFAYATQAGDIKLSDAYADEHKLVDGVLGGIRACTSLREKNPNLKVILSVHAPNQIFVYIARDPALRQNFGKSARHLMDMYGLNGIDICWIFPTNLQDGNYYADLLAATRQWLPAPKFTLTSAWPGHEMAFQHLSVFNAAIFLDFINVMAYDFCSPYRNFAGHHAQLYSHQDPRLPFSGSKAVQHLLQNRVPARKILLGIPTYGRSFLGVRGPGDTYRSMGGREGVFEYSELPLPGTREDVDLSAGAAYNISQQGGWVTYDNPDTVSMKADFVRNNKLGGLFYSESTSDSPGPRSLIANGYCRLHGE